ncbi:MAG: hypothetical protein HY712_00735 [candidate division NC10 bacterium]|nr:hypothetical protein [candidate division NC10 bacterium]
MSTKVLSLAAGILLLAGCAGMGAGGSSSSVFAPYPPPGMDHQVGAEHVELFWRCLRPEPGLLRLDGLAMNRSSPHPVQFFKAELVGVDAGERTRSSGRAEARDIVIRTYEASPFEIVLREGGDEVRFDLYYDYQAQIPDHIILSAGARFRMFAYYQRYLARDACNPAAHRSGPSSITQ